MRTVLRRLLSPFIPSQFRRPSGILGRYITRVMTEKNRMVYPVLDRYAGLESGMHMLEIGYGPGTGLEHFLSHYDVTVRGIDFSRLMYRKASDRIGRYIREGKVSLECGDFLEANVPAYAYDRVVFANVVYFWNEIAGPFGKIFHSLKPGGKLVFFTADRKALEKNPDTRGPVFNRHETADIISCLHGIGFEEIHKHAVINDSGDFLVISASKPGNASAHGATGA